LRDIQECGGIPENVPIKVELFGKVAEFIRPRGFIRRRVNGSTLGMTIVVRLFELPIVAFP
jgi:hypothetical protein